MSGNVYSLAERFATAMLVDGGVVAWIGSDAGAQVHRGDADRVVELDGDLLAPGFVDLSSDAPHRARGFVHAQTGGVAVADRWGPPQYEGAGAAPLAVVPRDPCRLRSRISAGLATALAPVPGAGGWETLRAAVHEVDAAERISARAAFSALTRGAWRILGDPGGGILEVGAQSTFVRWRVADLVVQTPDERISNWSTDPRAATPGLPPLGPGRPLPELAGMWLLGREQYA